MHLTPREVDKLILHQAGFLAQKRLARGLRLNYVEAVALIATQLLEFIRDGRSVAELMDLGRRFLGTGDVLDGIADMVDEVQVEGTFPDGTKLVTVHHPIVAERGDRELALYGSFLTPRTPERAPDPPAAPLAGAPGEVLAAAGSITLNEGRDAVSLSVANTGTGPSRSAATTLLRDQPRARLQPRGPTDAGWTYPRHRVRSSPARPGRPRWCPSRVRGWSAAATPGRADRWTNHATWRTWSRPCRTR